MLDAFPPDAAREGDLTNGMSTPRAEFEPIHQDRWGTVYRGERVLCTGVWIEEVLRKPEGEVCFLESTVRGFGQLIGMVPIEQLHQVEVAYRDMEQRCRDLEKMLDEKVMVETVVKRAVDSALEEVIPPLVAQSADPSDPSDPSPGSSEESDIDGGIPTADVAIEVPKAPAGAPPPSDADLAKIAKRRR